MKWQRLCVKRAPHRPPPLLLNQEARVQRGLSLLCVRGLGHEASCAGPTMLTCHTTHPGCQHRWQERMQGGPCCFHTRTHRHSSGRQGVHDGHSSSVRCVQVNEGVGAAADTQATPGMFLPKATPMARPPLAQSAAGQWCTASPFTFNRFLQWHA
jgi:hypothetical protein